MNAVEAGWLIGASGLFGETTKGWERIGAGAFGVTAILRTQQGLLVGTDGGLWQIPAGTDQWIQWHDETLTLVQALISVPAGTGAAAASAYGVATGELDELGAPRWQWHSDSLSVNCRFTNDLLVDPGCDGRWLAATEGGVLLTENSGGAWTPTSLAGVPVRTLCHADGAFWAGADQGGIWRSCDGEDWTRAGQGLEPIPVFAVAWAGDRFIAGTDRGVAQGDGKGTWVLSGAPLRVAAVAAAGSRWLAGASPGGLWSSEDAGEIWQRTGSFDNVRLIEPPEGE